MRLIIKLQNSNVFEQTRREYIRNFIYNCLQNSLWSFYHDKPRYKHFSFSNLFPFNEDGKIYSDFNLIISSPYEKFIRVIQEKVEKSGTIELGDHNFRVINTRLISTPKVISKVITATPIIVRLPENLYKKYGIDSQKKYEFWKETEVLNAFMYLLANNLQSRYENFQIESEMIGQKGKSDSNPEELRIFSTLKYKKTVLGWDKHFTGTMWEFGIADKYQNSPVVQYMYESGLGERNASSGSGFLNLVK